MKYFIRSLFHEVEILTRDLPEAFSLGLKENIVTVSRTALWFLISLNSMICLTRKIKEKYSLKLNSTYRNKESLVIKLNSIQGIKIIFCVVP